MLSAARRERSVSNGAESSKSAGAVRGFFKDIAPTVVAIVALVLSFITANIERAARKEELVRSSNLELEKEVRLQKRLVLLRILRDANTCSRDCSVLAHLKTSPQSSEFRAATLSLKRNIQALEDTGVEVDAALPKSVRDLVRPVWMAMEVVMSHAFRMMDPTTKSIPDLDADVKKVVAEYATLLAEAQRQLDADKGGRES